MKYELGGEIVSSLERDCDLVLALAMGPCELHMTEEEIQPWKKKSTLTLQGPGGSPTITLV